MSIPHDIVPAPDGVPVPAVEGVDLEAIEAREPRIRELAKDLQENNRGWLGEYYWLIDVLPLVAAHRALLARIAGLEAERDRAERDAEKIIAERDYYQDEIGRIAAAVGCEHEWSNLHAHACCIDDAFDALSAERDAARASARALREQMGEARGILAKHLSPFPNAPGWVEAAFAALSREPTVAPHVDVRERRSLDDMTEAEIEAELRADGVDVDAFVARMREAVDKAGAAERTRVAKTPAEVAQGRPCPIHGFSRSSCDCAALFACEDAPAKLGKDGPR